MIEINFLHKRQESISSYGPIAAFQNDSILWVKRKYVTMPKTNTNSMIQWALCTQAHKRRRICLSSQCQKRETKEENTQSIECEAMKNRYCIPRVNVSAFLLIVAFRRFFFNKTLCVHSIRWRYLVKSKVRKGDKESAINIAKRIQWKKEEAAGSVGASMRVNRFVQSPRGIFRLQLNCVCEICYDNRISEQQAHGQQSMPDNQCGNTNSRKFITISNAIWHFDRYCFWL